MTINDYLKKASSACALPDTCVRIQEMMDDEKSTIDEISEVLAYDPMVTGHMLKLANSALYNLSFSVDTVPKAVNVLGMDAVYSLLLASSTAETLRSLDTSAIDIDRHWRCSIYAGLIFKYLAKKTRQKNGEGLFVCGLLHNIGELVVAQVSPDKAIACDQLEENVLPYERQLEVLGFTYADLTAALFRHWQLPSYMTQLVASQHRPGDSQLQKLMFISCRLSLLNGYAHLYTADELAPMQTVQEARIQADDIDDARDWASIGAFSIFNIVCPPEMGIY
ncbi:HDOD domain-containing protein [Gayadomonas joobiniege]|uniref:HDOD domain-containing protein n=1 Tax=Gayadomonas joobiniege TaxID=1234606 RepID=UPI000379A748|nr:HDOD domain-containing protein [Gayadomonas joobiniege]